MSKRMKEAKPKTEINIALLRLGMNGFRDISANPLRMKTVMESIRILRDQQAFDVVALPAGTFTVKREMDAGPLLEPIFTLAEELNIAIAVGVDESHAQTLVYGKAQEIEDLTVYHNMPCYVYCRDSSGAFHVFRQRTMDNMQARNCWSSQWLAESERKMTVCGIPLEIVICGECYDQRVRDGIFKRGSNLSLILGHFTMPRFMRTAKMLARINFPFLQLDHRITSDGLFHGACRKKVLSCRNGFWIDHPYDLWSQVSIWKWSNEARLTPLFF